MTFQSIYRVKMPALVTCRGNKVLEKRWNVGSDDFVLPAFLAMVNGVFVYVTSIVYSLYNYVVLKPDRHPGTCVRVCYQLQ